MGVFPKQYFPDESYIGDGEYPVGIYVMGLGACYMFHPDEYEIVN